MENSFDPQINVKIDDAALKGVYSNAMGISHSKEEFVLDFMMVYGWQKAGIVTARVILSPIHLKKIQKAIDKNIEKYERNFGKIEPVLSGKVKN